MVHVLNLALPPQRLRPYIQPEHQDPVSHMAAMLEGLLKRWGVAVAHHGDKDTGGRSSGKYLTIFS